MILEKNFTIVDVETTGGSPFFNRLIEIGLLRVEKGEVVEEYQTLLNPGMPIPEFISQMTGITDSHVALAPTFPDLADEILSKFENAIFVAHNAQFDYGFIKEEFRRIGYGFNAQQLCTVKLSRALYKEHRHHNLTSIIERYNFECANRHRAFDDAKVLWDFLQHCHGNIPAEDLMKVLRRMIREPKFTRVAASAKPKPKTILKLHSKTLSTVDELVYETEAGETFSLG